MKQFLLLLPIIWLSACSVNRDYLLRADEDKTFYDVVKRLNKKSTDEDATKALATVYSLAKERHLKKIATYTNYTDISKWDKLSAEYGILQNMFDAIDNSDAAGSLVTPVSFQNQLNQTREGAAEDYYRLGDSYFSNNGREYARQAYNAYKKSTGWVKDYKDAQAKMDEAYNSSIVNILINPIHDNSFFFNAGWGSTGYNYSNEYFQQNLVNDLGGKYASRYPARFYTQATATYDNVEPDWLVDLTLRNMDIPRPAVYNYSRNVSKKIEVGSDTAGKPIYQTVHATLNIQRQSFNARATMDVNIVEIASRKNIDYRTFNDTYNWQQEVATYSGDRRALSNADLALVNNKYNTPRREDILNELYRNIYPQVKNNIVSAANW